MENNNSKTIKLYNSLVEDGYDNLGDYKSFEGKLKDSGKRESLYKTLTEDGYDNLGSLSEFNDNLGYPDIVEPVKQESDNDITAAEETNTSILSRGTEYVGDVVQRIGAGASEVVKSASSLTGKLAKGVNAIQENQFGNAFLNTLKGTPLLPVVSALEGIGTVEKVSPGVYDNISQGASNIGEDLRKKSDFYQGKNFIDLWKDGNYGGAVGEVFLTASESLPQSLAAMFGGGAGLGATGAMVANLKYDELDESNPDMGEAAKITNAVLTGTAEALSEKLGDVPIGKWLKSVYGKAGKEAAENAVQKGLSGWMQQQFKKYGVLFAPVAEGVEEVSSQIAENITDKVTGADPTRGITDGLLESFVYGTGGGAQFSMAAIPGLAHNKIRKVQTNKDWKNSQEQFKNAFSSDPDAQSFIDGISSMKPEEQAFVLDGLLKDDTLSEEQKKAASNLVENNVTYRSLRSPDAIQEDRKARNELLINTQLNNFDKEMSPLVSENGNLQQVYIDGNQEPVFIIKGNVATIDENGETHFDPQNSDDALYYVDSNGETKVISPNQISNIESILPYSDIRSEFEANLRAEQEAMEQMLTIEEQESAIENGDDVVFIDDSGNQVQAKVTDAFSNPEHVMLEDGQMIPRERVVKAEQMPKTPTQTIISEFSDENLNESLSNINRTLESGKWKDEQASELLAKKAEIEKEIERRVAKEQIQPSENPEIEAIGVENTLSQNITNQQQNVDNLIGNHVENEGVSPAKQSNVSETEQSSLDTILSNAPKQKNGKVDYNALMESDPLSFAQVWESRSGAESTKNQLQRVSDNLNKQIESQQRKLENEVDFNRIADIEDSIIELQGKKQRIDDVVRDRYAPEEAIQSDAKQMDETTPKAFGERLRVLNGDIHTVRDNILLGIANGSYKFNWKGSDTTHGLAGELGLSDSEQERRSRINILSNNGYTPETLAHRIWEESDGRYDTEEVRNEIIDVLQSVKSRTEALSELESRLKPSQENQSELQEQNEYERERELLKREENDEIIQQLAEEELLYLRNQAAESGITVKELDNLFTANDLIDYLEQTKYGRQESNTGRSNEEAEISQSERNSTESTERRAVENNRSGENQGIEDGYSDSRADGNEISDKFSEESSNLSEQIAKAEQEVNTNPTEAQKEAGNYKKGHVTIQGFDITIEQPAGSVRSGVDQTGKEWSIEMKNTYGYFKRTEGKDGDHIDVFLGTNPESQNVFVVDQVNQDGTFDEHKVLLGFDTIDHARDAYLSNYEDSWQGLGYITGVELEDFRKWLDNGTRRIKPFAEYNTNKKTPYRTRETRIRKTNAGWSLEEKVSEKDMKNHPQITYIKDDNGDSWSVIMTSKSKKELGDYLDDSGIRFRDNQDVSDELENVNNKFNEELDSLTLENADKTILNLGHPSEKLLSTGIENKPLKLYGNKLLKKAKKHGFSAKDVKNLPKAIANPISVFKGSHYRSYSILTELSLNGNNVLVSIETGKGGDVSFNMITSTYGKFSDGVVRWINDGKLLYADKEKALNYLHFPAPIAAASNNQELSTATNIVNSFENPTKKQGEIVSSINDISDRLNTPVRIIRDVNNITDEDTTLQKRKRSSKGWYDIKAGETILVLPNATSIADAQATILHEVVGHKGLRNLLGESFGPTMESVFDSLPSDVQSMLSDEFNGDKVTAAEEYCSEMAETLSEPSIIQKIASAIRSFLRSKLGVNLKMSDGDIMYMLWKSKNRLQNGTAIDIMNNISMSNSVKENTKQYDELFRSSNPIGLLSVSPETKVGIKGKISSYGELLHEGYVDKMLSVRKLQESIAEKTGKPIPDYQNVYMYENTLSSRNTYEIAVFKLNLLKPLKSAMKDLVDHGMNEREIETYVIAKHGLERNDYMRLDRLRKYVDSIEDAELHNKLQSMISVDKFSELGVLEDENLEALRQEVEKRDFSGLTAIEKELDNISVDEYINSTEKEFAPEIKELWKRIRAINNYSLKKWFDSGMVDREGYEKIKGMYKYYVPLRGFDELVAHDVYDYYVQTDSPFNNPLKTATGRISRADNPFPHMVSMAESSIVGGNKNLMKLHLYRLVQGNQSDEMSINKQWFVYKETTSDGEQVFEPSYPKYDEDIEVNRKNIEQYNADMLKLEAEGKAFHKKGGLKVPYKIAKVEANEHIVNVKLNGEDYQVLFHGSPKVSQAINGLNDQSRTDNKFVKAVAWANRQMAANFTTRNPAFVVSNLSRDVIWATSTLGVKEGRKYRNKFIRNIPNASAALIRNIKGKPDMNNPVDVMLKEFLENGGRTGYTALYSIEKYRKDIENSLKTGTWAKTKRGYNAVLDFMMLPNEWAEDLSRFSTYITSRQEGRSILRSTSDAKEVTVNFNRKGSGAMGAAVFRSLYLFFNAAVQGLNNFNGQFKKNPTGATIMVSSYCVAGSLIPVILSMLGADEDREKYMNLPDYVRKNNICIPLGWLGMDGFIKIPLPIELRAFYGIGDAAVRAFMGDDESVEALNDSVLGLMDLLPLNPSGGTSNIWPDALKPMVESFVYNKDFTGKPIAKITPFNQYAPEYQRVYRSTSAAPIKISQYLNYLLGGDEVEKSKFEKFLAKSGFKVNPSNPAAIEHLFEAYLGGMFTTANQTFKTLVGAPTGINDFSWRTVPVLNRFYDTGEVNGTMMKVNEKYYDLLDEMRESKHIVREYEKNADAGTWMNSAKALKKLEEFENSDRWRRAEYIEEMSESVNDLNEELSEATDDAVKKEIQENINLIKKEMVDALKKGKAPE